MQNCDSEVREVTMEMEWNELIQKKEWPNVEWTPDKVKCRIQE